MLQPSSIIVNDPIASVAVRISDQKRDLLLTLFKLRSPGQTLEVVRWATKCSGSHRVKLR